jgi:hypothetical protein
MGLKGLSGLALSGILAHDTNTSDILDGIYTQSSVYLPGSGLSDGTITAAKMTDEFSSGNTLYSWAGTNRVVESWIACAHEVSTITGVKVQAGEPNGWGGIQSYLKGCQIQTLTGITWTTRAVISGVSDSSPNTVYTISFPPVGNVTAIRIFNRAL